MAYLNFTEALMEAKRRAQLQGRPLSEQEARGISEGYARAAGEKNIAESSLTQQESQFARQLAQRKFEEAEKMRIAEQEREHEKMRGIASGVAGTAGGIVGGIFGGIPGAGVGASAGSAIGPTMYEIDPLKPLAKRIVGASSEDWKKYGGGALAATDPAFGGLYAVTKGFGSCIIISSCTSSDSHEVQIAREYRDRYMDVETLTGYYLLCQWVVPRIRKYPLFKAMVKRMLVDRLVDFGEVDLGYKPKRGMWSSWMVTNSFLSVCRCLGVMADRILEANHG